ncbi:MAG: Nif3-like dinuclear metal center hexameric protein [Pirellulales bacterium]|nr:Nif3-like dinuclear metal center hexameric protein [Pirellulales bacterium]
MLPLAAILDFLEQFAPVGLAEDWDNVGLLVGRRDRTVRRVMTCLTVTPPTAAEAIARETDLIVTHHPMPFHSLKRVTDESPTGRLLLDLIAAGVAVYSPHTAFDSAQRGINQRLAEGLGLRGISPLVAGPDGGGAGRVGWLDDELTLAQLIDRVKGFLGLQSLQRVGPADRTVRTVAVTCGAAGEFLPAAHEAGCDTMVLGEARFHTCLEAEALGLALVLPGHFATERFAVEALVDTLSQQFPGLDVWASREERDPLCWG